MPQRTQRINVRLTDTAAAALALVRERQLVPTPTATIASLALERGLVALAEAIPTAERQPEPPTLAPSPPTPPIRFANLMFDRAELEAMLAAGHIPAPEPTPERQPEPATEPILGDPQDAVELPDAGSELAFTDVEVSADSVVFTDIVAIEQPAAEHAETLPAFRELAPASSEPEDDLTDLLGQF